MCKKVRNMFKFLCVLLSITVSCVLPKVATQYLDVPPIACPQYFEYLCYGSICIGKITLRNVQLGVTNIHVEFSQRYPVEQNNYGSLSLFEDKDETIERIRRRQPISYRVDFPLSNVLPKLTKLAVNSAVVCQASGFPPPSTTITQQHTLTASVYSRFNSVPYTNYNEPYYNEPYYNEPEQPQYGYNTQPVPRPQQQHHRTKPLKPKKTHTQSIHKEYSSSRPKMQPFSREPTAIQPNYFTDPYGQTSAQQTQQPNFFQPRESETQTAFQQIPQPSFIQHREPIQQIRQPSFIQAKEPIQQIQQPSFIQSREPIQQIQQPSFIQSAAQVSQSSIQDYCGREGATSAIVPYISGGSIVQRGQFPWLTAIYHKSVRGTSFLCGGSLISARTILSAAHCFQLIQVTADKIMVTLGRYNLSNSMETSVVTRDVKTLLINPEYDPNMFTDADVALLIMSAPVSFNEFIRPICLWSGPDDPNLLINETGYVAGWGDDEEGHGISAVPKRAPASIVSETICRQSSDLLKVLTSSRTLCAGQQDGVGPCSGDSGSGLMIQRNGIWQLRGVVSAGHSDRTRCNLRQYVIYCDVAKFSSWIHTYML